MAPNPLSDLREVSGAEVMQNPLSAIVVEEPDIIIFVLKPKLTVRPAIYCWPSAHAVRLCSPSSWSNLELSSLSCLMNLPRQFALNSGKTWSVGKSVFRNGYCWHKETTPEFSHYGVFVASATGGAPVQNTGLLF